MAERFYINCPILQEQVILQGAEAHHLATVSRKKPGETVVLFTGDGWEYEARIDRVGRRMVALEVVGRQYRPRLPPVELVAAVPLPKGDRAQFLVEKLTELGVAKFIPLQAQRAVIPAAKVNRDKLERWVIEACKQCGRNMRMEIATPVTAQDLFTSDTSRALRLVARRQGQPLRDVLNGEWPKVVFAVGPEGGWTESETSLANANGWMPVHLGERILRTETAALAVAAYATVQSS